MRAVGSKIGADSCSFRNDTALWETIEVSVHVMLYLQQWDMSLLNILEELSWCIRW